MPYEFQRHLQVPICKINCITPNEEPIEVVTWGEDELGRLVCHARPSSFSGSTAVEVCNETQNAHCEFARIKLEQEMPPRRCELIESFPYSVCNTVFKYELDGGELHSGSFFFKRPENFPECDVVIEHD
jgi:hypothetical protein